MKFLTNQRLLLRLGLVALLIFVPLAGGLHHHDHGDDQGGVCWFCMVSSSPALPAVAIALGLCLAAAAIAVEEVSAPRRALRTAHHRRGPPFSILA